MSAFRSLYHWIDSKLNRKYVLGMASGLVAISIVFASMFINLYQNQLKHELGNTSMQLNWLLQAALERSMIMRDLDGIQEVITRFGKQAEIKNVMIVNTKGEIRLATGDEAGEALVGTIDHNLGRATEDTTVFINLSSRGEVVDEVLRSINPIHNQDACHHCHGLVKDNPINGILVVDYDASMLKRNALHTTLALMGAGSTVVLITLFGGWWFMGQFVLKPVRQLLTAQQDFSAGDLQARVDVKGGDEISQLGKSFNSMSQEIEKQWNNLESRKQFLQSLIDGIPDGVRVLDQNCNILLANQAYVDQCNSSMDEVLKSKCFKLHKRTKPCVPTMETCPLYEIKKHKKPIKTLHHHVDDGGEDQPVEVFAAAIEGGETWGKTPIIIEVIRDLSKSVDYSQEQRLTSLGMLASGVAHEIHNPLASIQIAFQSIDQWIEKEDPKIDQLKVYISLIEGEIDKCVDITGRLLKLGDLPETHLQPINVNTVITETLSLLRWEANSKKILMTIDLPDQSPRVLATDSELRMMILNLVQNAYHAMPDGGELHITVSTETTKTNHEDILITIKDTGVGIPNDIQNRIFDPFVSHRPAGKSKGTGLGLAITKAIVKRFKGTINVFSQQGDGTCFTVILPDADVVCHPLNDKTPNNQEFL